MSQNSAFLSKSIKLAGDLEFRETSTNSNILSNMGIILGAGYDRDSVNSDYECDVEV